MVLVWYKKLQNYCGDDTHSSDILKEIKKQTFQSLKNKIEKRISVFHFVATLLDPRFKHLSFITVEEQRKAKTQLINLCLYCENGFNFESIAEDAEIEGLKLRSSEDTEFLEFFQPNETRDSESKGRDCMLFQ